MSLQETIVTEAIATEYFRKLQSSLHLDVAVIGAGPSGMTAAWRLAEAGCNIAVFERKLSIGGGMWGGGMTWNFIVVQQESRQTLEEAGLTLQEFRPGYYTVDAVAATTTLASKAALAGTKFFTCISVEDVVLREIQGRKQVTGIVINSSPVEMVGLHVDPLVLECKCLLESTGHDLEVLKTLVRKNDVRLDTPTGGLQGEQSMWAEVAEKTTVENTREIFPGVFVAGMAANAAFGSFRMGPIFGGMFLSGEKAAQQIRKRLGHEL